MSFTVEDFHQLIALLEQHPEWRAELRRMVLSEELLQLPDLVRELVVAQKRTDERVDKLAEQLVQLTALVHQLAEQLAQLTKRVDQLAEQLAQLTARVDQIAEQLAQLTKRVDQLTERVDQLTARVDQLAEQLVLLTKRVDQLTARVDQLTERVDQLTARVDQLAEQLVLLTKRVDQLTARVDQLTERVDQLTQRMDALVTWANRVTDDLGKLKQWSLEHLYSSRAPAFFGKMVKRAHALTSEELDAMLGDALEAGKITLEERDDLLLTDLVVRGRWHEDGEPVYLVVEISWGIGLDDTRRVRERAQTFTKLGVRAVPVVAGERATEDARAEAHEFGIWQVTDGRIYPPDKHRTPLSPESV